RILLLRTHVWDQASDAMKDAVETAAKAAKVAGAQVSEIAMPQALQDAWDAHPTIQDYEAYRALAFEYDNHRDKLSVPLRKLLDAAAAIKPEAYDDARRVTSRARLALADLMADADVILTPSAPSAAPVTLASSVSPIFNR